MGNLLNLFTYKELFTMGIVLGVLIILIVILVISDLISKKHTKKLILENMEVINANLDCSNNLDLNSNIDVKEDSSLNLETDLVKSEELVSFDANLITNEKEDLVTNLELTEINVLENSQVNTVEKEEIEELFIEIEEPKIVKVGDMNNGLNSQEKAKIEIQKLEDSLEHQLSLEDTITNLETIEEENAIISYQELLENTKELNIVLEDDGDEPITIDEVFKLFNNENDEGIILTESLDVTPITMAYNGDFTSTPHLSPVNGVENENLAEIQLENTANLEKLDREIRKTNHFLNILNELKKNLE